MRQTWTCHRVLSRECVYSVKYSCGVYAIDGVRFHKQGSYIFSGPSIGIMSIKYDVQNCNHSPWMHVVCTVRSTITTHTQNSIYIKCIHRKRNLSNICNWNAHRIPYAFSHCCCCCCCNCRVISVLLLMSIIIYVWSVSSKCWLVLYECALATIMWMCECMHRCTIGCELLLSDILNYMVILWNWEIVVANIMGILVWITSFKRNNVPTAHSWLYSLLLFLLLLMSFTFIFHTGEHGLRTLTLLLG